MITLIDLEFFYYLEDYFEKATGINIPDNTYAKIVLCIIVLSILFLLCRTLYKYLIKPFINNHMWRKQQLEEILKGYEQYTTKQQRWLYIKTWFQSNPPHDLDEPYQAQFEDPRTDSIDFFIKQVLRRDNQKSPYYCILGGSGMGKSTFVVNLVRKYIKKYTEKTLPYPIKLFNCGDYNEKDKIIDRIKSIDKDSQKNTILILDALDENNEAIVNYTFFFDDLITSIKEFRIVIITCRTQFFERSEDEPNVFPGHEPATKEHRRFKKYYLSPLRDEEVNHYLNKKYVLRFSTKRKAKAIVNNCKQIMARPLLLSYLNDLLKSEIENREESIVQIYEILINKWLEREANFASTDEKKETYIQTLRAFSNELALCMAQPSYSKQQVDDIIAKYGANTLIKEKNLKGRSLLNRDSKNVFKFAHKSFMEFLVAKQLSKPNNILLESIDCVSNDMIPLFLSYELTLNILSNISSYGYDEKIIKNIYFSNILSFDPVKKTNKFYEYGEDTVYKRFEGIHIHVACDITDNIEKYLFYIINSFSKNIKKERINIHIDGRYDYSRIGGVIFQNILHRLIFVDAHTDDLELEEKYSLDIEREVIDSILYKKNEEFWLPRLIFVNYKFEDNTIVRLLENLKFYDSVNIVIRDPVTIRKGDTCILWKLSHLETAVWIQGYNKDYAIPLNMILFKDDNNQRYQPYIIHNADKRE